MFQTVQIDGSRDLFIKISLKCSPICSIGKVAFHATVTFHYTVDELCAEFCTLEAWVKAYDGVVMTIEDLFITMFEGFLDIVKPSYLYVVVYAETAAHPPVRISRKEFML